MTDSERFGNSERIGGGLLAPRAIASFCFVFWKFSKSFELFSFSGLFFFDEKKLENKKKETHLVSPRRYGLHEVVYRDEEVN